MPPPFIGFQTATNLKASAYCLAERNINCFWGFNVYLIGINSGRGYHLNCWTAVHTERFDQSNIDV
jgi:hypothetical protein